MAHMASRTRRRDSSGHVDRFFDRRKRYQAVFEMLGLDESFSRLPRRIQEKLWQCKFPDPTLAFDDRFAAGAGEQALRKQLAARFAAATFTIDSEAEVAAGQRMSVRDFVAVVAASMLAVSNTKLEAGMPPELVRFLTEAKSVLGRFY
jgi:hypothetical protein